METAGYKEPNFIWKWLQTALKHEWQKHAATPVKPDMVPGHEVAQAWGFVVAGYSLLEQGLKAVLYVRGKQPEKTHALSVLFAALPDEDQDVLRAYYDDFRAAFHDMVSFPLLTLDDFLVNLDGGRNARGQHIGSFDWRYFLTEQGSGAPMPLVSINVLHEVTFGCVQLVGSIDKKDGKARGWTYSWRLRWGRSRRYEDWLTVRMNSAGWAEEGNRLEIVGGPHSGDRYDYFVFEDGRIRSFFAPLPDAGDSELPIIDKRRDVELFDTEEGYRSIGVTMNRPRDNPESDRAHVMF